jgi:hypothetical protein
MAKALNFRKFAQPTLPINMNDAEETLFTVTTPSVELVERLEANQAEIVAALNRGDRESLSDVWNLAAHLISCNRECRQVTAEELKGKYGVNYKMLFEFFNAYEEFLGEIKSAKN